MAFGGFTFHAGSDRYNIYYDGSQYYELAGAACWAATRGSAGPLGTPINFTVRSVPEPTAIALLGAGMLGFGVARRRKQAA